MPTYVAYAITAMQYQWTIGPTFLSQLLRANDRLQGRS